MNMLKFTLFSFACIFALGNSANVGICANRSLDTENHNTTHLPVQMYTQEAVSAAVNNAVVKEREKIYESECIGGLLLMSFGVVQSYAFPHSNYAFWFISGGTLVGDSILKSLLKSLMSK